MKCKRRFMHGKRLRRSPIKEVTSEGYDFSNQPAYTGKGTIGEKLATSYADKFKTIKGALSEIIPLGKAKKTIKVAKYLYDTAKKEA